MERQQQEGSSFPIPFGRYVLLKRLGEGGMSTVYLGEQRGHGGFSRTVAVKTLHPHLAAHPEVAQLFIGEARLGGHLVHPNVVQTLDFGEESGQLFLAMEYIHGLTLAQVIAAYREARRYIPLEVVLEAIIQVAHGLGYAHEARDARGAALKMVHRDLKPSNILLGRHGEVKVCDFGVARSASSVLHTQASGMLRGTCRYMSPEQAWGRRDLDSRSDIFALGLVLYECLTLEPMYNLRQNEALLRLAQDAEIEPRLERVPPSGLREDLLRILRRTMAAERGERYQRAQELGADLAGLRQLLPASRSLGTWMVEALSLAGAPERPDPSPYAPPQLGEEDEEENTEETPTVRLVPPKVSVPGFGAVALAPGVPDLAMGTPPQTLSRGRPHTGSGASISRSGAMPRDPGSRNRGIAIAMGIVSLGGLIMAGVLLGPTLARRSAPVVQVDPGGPVAEGVAAGAGASALFAPTGATRSSSGDALTEDGEGGGAPEGGAGAEGAGLEAPLGGDPDGDHPAALDPGEGTEGDIDPEAPRSGASTASGAKQSGSGSRSGGGAKAVKGDAPKTPTSAKTKTPATQKSPEPAKVEDPAPPLAVASIRACDSAPAGAGALVLNARPPADVRLDGKAIGASPACAPSVSPGSHTLSFEVAGQPPMTHTVTVVSGKITRCTAFFSKYAVSCRED